MVKQAAKRGKIHRNARYAMFVCSSVRFLFFFWVWWEMLEVSGWGEEGEDEDEHI